MTPERWRQIDELYHAARERGREVLADADPELRRKVEELLAQDTARDGLLDRPAAEMLGDSSVMSLATGTQLGPYRIEASIGKGGMGEVWKAHDSRLNRDVAIKISAQQFTDRFEREARSIAALNHSNICTLYDVGPNYLVMELIEGPTLSERIARGAIPLEEALPIAKQIADALEAAHEKGIVHRDLKPANIKVRPDGSIKVLDFGLAKTAEDAEFTSDSPTRLSVSGTILGTAGYMSPEQARGEKVDKRADIWAFGVVLYEMLVGERLFERATLSDTLAAVLREEPEWSRVPAEVQRLLGSCLEKDPRKRLRDIGDVWRLLEQGRESATVRSARPWPRVVAGVATVIAAVALWAPWRSLNPVDRPLMRLDVSLGPDALLGANSTVAISPDGARMVFPIRGADGKPLLATRLLDRAMITPLPGTENGYAAFFSPDSQWIGFTADNKLKKISLRGGTPVTLSDIAAFGGASWGENGDIVASLNVVGGLLSISASGGLPHSVTNVGKEEFNHLMPQVLPGGNAVLFTAQKASDFLEDANIEVVSLKNGAVKTLLSGGYSGRYLATNGSAGHLVYLSRGVLYAVAFDPVRLEVRGKPEPILEDTGTGGFTFPFDVSRNGTFVYHAGIATDQKWPIVWMDSSGKTEPLVTALGSYIYPRFSPDGKRLVLSVGAAQGGDILVYDRHRDTLSRLTSGGRLNFSPVWSRDAEHVVFASNGAGGSQMSWIRADGSGEKQVLRESRNVTTPSGFSPDGQRLAYDELKPDGDIDLWILPLDSSNPEHPKAGKPVPFLQTPAVEAQLVFSPDSRYVAYFSNESGAYEVYVRPAPGPDGKPRPGKWQISTGGISSYPVWSPNGRELFYRAGNRIMVTDYTSTGGSFFSNKPRVWSDRQIRTVGASLPFALAPDGKHFAVFPRPETKADDKGPAHVTFLLNFFDELRRRVPAGK